MKRPVYVCTGLYLGRNSFLVDRRIKSTENSVRVFLLRDKVLSRNLRIIRYEWQWRYLRNIRLVSQLVQKFAAQRMCPTSTSCATPSKL
jgi:hypothetical protein